LSTELAHLVKKADLIVWDEAPMCHKHALQAVDKTLRDIMRTVSPELENIPFGNKAVVLGGDFRQVLPVVKRGSRGKIVSAILKRSGLWPQVRVMKLNINMRVATLQGVCETARCVRNKGLLIVSWP
jgi:hypothetical protein